MNTALETPQGVLAALENLQVLVDQLRGQFVDGIEDAEGYARATLLLDELTDGHELNKYEERILIELEDAIQAYESGASQFKEMNTRPTPVQLLKDLMETQSLTGSDLPEIGDKTAVSKILNGDRPISHKMAFALAARFNMDPKAFVQPDSAPSGTPGLTVYSSTVTLRRHRSPENVRALVDLSGANPLVVRIGVKERDENRLVASSRKRPEKPGPIKG